MSVQCFYDSMLLNFESDNYDVVSSMGYAFGYLGGGLAFVLSLYYLHARESSVDLVHQKNCFHNCSAMVDDIHDTSIFILERRKTVSTTVLIHFVKLD